MNFYETLGWFLTTLTSLLGWALIGYCAFRGARELKHHIARGKFENDLDIKEAIEQRYLERMVAR